MTTNDTGAAADVQAVMDRMVAGYAKRDLDMIMSCYEPQAAYALHPGEAATGSAALRQLFEGILASDPKFNFISHEIVLADELALHISAYDAQAAGGVHRGLSVAVLRRQADGGWLMVMDHPAGHRLLP